MDPLESRARHAIDAAHDRDPERDGSRAAEAAYADRIEGWVNRLVEMPALPLRLAARAQHLERWTIPRDAYAGDRGGYLRWRNAVHERQGDRVRELLAGSGCDPALVEQVARLVAKKASKDDADAAALEDAACLVFLETELAAFAREHPREKVLDVLRKTWNKMGAAGRAAALGLPLPGELRALVEAALG